jgi:protein ImuB
MFAAIYIPDFPVEAIVRLKPELRERAVAVVEGTPPLVRVLAVNERASDAGLEPGMTKLQAEEHIAACNGVLASRSPEQEASAQAALLDAACGFSPRVEDTAPGLIVLDLDGLERIFGPVAKMARDIARRCSEIGLEAQIAVAANPDAAIHAARGFSGVTVIPEGREAERLATLPVDVLVSPASLSRGDADGSTPAKQLSKNSRALTLAGQELLNTFETWGVRNLRSLAALPEVAVAERLGPAGLHWQRLARGATSRALKLIEPPARFEETCELEYPVESLEPLSFLLHRMLEQLCARLSARALATNELRIALLLDPIEDIESNAEPIEDRLKTYATANLQSPIADQKWFYRSLRLPVPMLDPKVFLKLLQLDLQAHSPGAPVLKISIEAHPAEPRRTQNGLFQPGTPEPEKLEVTLARIQSMVDGQRSTALADDRKPTTDTLPFTSDLRVGTAELLDTHFPDAFKMDRFAPSTIDHHSPAASSNVTALRLFRPALNARVALRAGKPVHIECETVQGEILWAAGPWKSSGDWWNEKSWAREEWDVCVGEACYRIYRDPKGWFVEGSYD